MAGWNMLYFDEGRFQPDAGQNDAWNRGAYLAEGIAHCGACHTPRNSLGAEEKDRLYAGGEGEGWHAPALNGSSPAAVPWTEAALHDYLAQGYAEHHGVAAGPMRQVVRNLEQVDETDVSALATYVASLTGAPKDGAADAAIADARSKTYSILTAYQMDADGPAANGEAIFAGTCASCHMDGGTQPYVRPVDLALSSVVTGPDPRNLVHIIMDGVHPRPGERGAIMPGFGNVLDDGEVTRLANYVRDHFTDEPAWADVEKTVGDIRGEETAQ
jgi:mono/diheme cytochrome c family protein